MITLFLSCKTLPKQEILVWTEFPSPIVNGVSIVTLDGETVSMPLHYWKKIVSYVADTETNIKLLNNK